MAGKEEIHEVQERIFQTERAHLIAQREAAEKGRDIAWAAYEALAQGVDVLKLRARIEAWEKWDRIVRHLDHQLDNVPETLTRPEAYIRDQHSKHSEADEQRARDMEAGR